MKTESGIILPDNYQFYVKPTELEISQRKLEGYQKLAKIRQWGIKYPTRFMSEFIGVELLDSQEYTFMMSWINVFIIYCCCHIYFKEMSTMFLFWNIV